MQYIALIFLIWLQEHWSLSIGGRQILICAAMTAFAIVLQLDKETLENTQKV